MTVPSPPPDLRFLQSLNRLLVEADQSSRNNPTGAKAEEVGAIEAAVQELRQKWVEWVHAGNRASVSKVHEQCRYWRSRIEELPDEERRIGFEWSRVKNRWFKIRLGEPPPPLPDRRSAAHEAMAWLLELKEELRYESELLGRTHACDCDAASASGRAPSATLERVGPWTDGYHQGNEYRCGECGAHWASGIRDDSAGSGFWERIVRPS